MKVQNTHSKASIIGYAVSKVKNKTIFKAERNYRVFELRAQGYSYNMIARELNMTPQNVGIIVKKYKQYFQEVI